MLGSKAKNTDAIEKGENVGWDDLPQKHADESYPKELHSLVIDCNIEVKC